MASQSSPQLSSQMECVPEGGAWASLLAAKPLIIGTWPARRLPLGMATALGPLLQRRAVQFLLFPSGAWEPLDICIRLVAQTEAHRKAFPLHAFIFVCANRMQEQALALAGQPAVVINPNMMVDDSLFRPLPEITPRFDAIYTARLSPEKRHELATRVDSLCLVYFRDKGRQSSAQFRAAYARLRTLLPKATFLNPLTEEGCKFMSPELVNRAYSEARVGLCLSAVEGPMWASMEYMMAGLPVVSTRSIGGREHFFDKAYCAIVPADPRAVGDAARAMIGRKIPREHIRAKTMDKVGRERARFIALVQEIIDRAGGHLEFSAVFPKLMAEGRLKPWVTTRDFAALVLRAVAEPLPPVRSRTGD